MINAVSKVPKRTSDWRSGAMVMRNATCEECDVVTHWNTGTDEVQHFVYRYVTKTVL